jgi:hypothetical protein
LGLKSRRSDEVMGGAASVETPSGDPLAIQKRSRLVTAILNLANKPHHAPLVAAKTQWRIAQQFGGNNGEPSTNEQELLHMLHDPVGQKHIGTFAKKILTSETFFCWVEIKEFRDAPSIGYRKSMAKLIYKKYVKDGSPMALGSITSDLKALYDVSHWSATRLGEVLDANACVCVHGRNKSCRWMPATCTTSGPTSSTR